jgi:hypothetical protein
VEQGLHIPEAASEYWNAGHAAQARASKAFPAKALVPGGQVAVEAL